MPDSIDGARVRKSSASFKHATPRTANVGAGRGAVDSLTILRCDPHLRATKRVSMAHGGHVRIEGYDAGKHFAVAEAGVSDLRSLARVLDVTSHDPHACVIRGQPLPGVDRTRCRRLLYQHEDGTAPTFRDVPRRWAILDFDDVPGPYRFDPHDGELAAIYCRTLLPGPWQRCSYWWGLSSSAGFKLGVRIKLAFWLDRAVLGSELERHLTGCPIDASTLRAVQPIYIARPILIDLPDPIEHRTGREDDLHAAVQLPVLPMEKPKPSPITHSSAGRRYVSGSPPAVAEMRLAALCRAVERAGVGGRHRCLIWAASRAVELDDALPREEIAQALINAAQHAGLDDREPDLARQVRNGFKLGIFGTEAPS